MKKQIVKKVMTGILSTALAVGTLWIYPASPVKAETHIQTESIAMPGHPDFPSLGRNNTVYPLWKFSKKYKVTASVLNVRAGASTSHAITGQLYKGDTIKVKSINNGWAKFKQDGQWRYVSATYITEA